jgi:hypothetical protein
VPQQQPEQAGVVDVRETIFCSYQLHTQKGAHKAAEHGLSVQCCSICGGAPNKNWSMTITAGPASNLGWNCVGLQMGLLGPAWYLQLSRPQHKSSWPDTHRT